MKNKFKVITPSIILIMLVISTSTANASWHFQVGDAQSSQHGEHLQPTQLPVLVNHSATRNPNNIILKPSSYEPVPINVILNGINVTFMVSSNVTVDVYLFSSQQLSQFNSTGSESGGYVYHSSGTYINANVGSLAAGTYYLEIYNDISSEVANISYSYGTIPIDIYQYHSSLPAPVGIADYGVLNSSGVLYPYKVSYREAVGYADILSLSAYNPSPPSGISPYGASLQLNVVLLVNTTSGQYTYWLQDVPLFYTNNDTMYMEDNVWNFSAAVSYLSNSTIHGKGYVYYYGQSEYYAYGTNTHSYTLPLSIQLIIAYTYSVNGVNLGFGYSLNGASIAWYDNITISANKEVGASLLVDGYRTTPSSNYYDAELVFGGEGNGEATNFTRMNSTLIMHYVLQNGSMILPPAIYGFGSNTGEAADDLQTSLVNGYPTASIGTENFEPLGYSVNIPKFTAKVSAVQGPADAGMKVPISINSSILDGVAPYTYYFYVDGSPVYNFTTYSPSYNGTAYIPPLVAGYHELAIKVIDAVGNFRLFNLTILVNPDPTLSASLSQSFYDLGQPLTAYYKASGGTPPYAVSIIMDGFPILNGTAINATGTHTVYVKLIDSVGYVVNSNTIYLTVNPDPYINGTYTTSSNNFFYLNDLVSIDATTVGGTAPYNYTWYLNGKEVSITKSPSYTYTLTNMGNNTLTIIGEDAAGYTFQGTASVVFGYNYTSIITVIALAVSVGAIAGMVFIRRRKGQEEIVKPSKEPESRPPPAGVAVC